MSILESSDYYKMKKGGGGGGVVYDTEDTVCSTVRRVNIVSKTDSHVSRGRGRTGKGRNFLCRSRRNKLAVLQSVQYSQSSEK